MAKTNKHKGSLPPGWVVRISQKHDKKYYFNPVSGDSTWDFPSLDPPCNKSSSLGMISDDGSNDNSKRSLDSSSSSENFDISGTDEKFSPTMHREIFNYLENSSRKNNCDAIIDNKNIKLINSMANNAYSGSSNTASPQSNKKIKYNRMFEKNMVVNLNTSSQIRPPIMANQSDLDKVEDFKMLDVLPDLQLIDDIPTNTCSSYYIVIDTNILIHNLKQIDVIKDHDLDNCGPPHLFIPWVVIQELDALERDAKTKYAALDGCKYINKMIKKKHPRFHGQSPKEVKDWTRHCYDDRILECCMSLADKIPSDKVVLLTNNIPLAEKSVICDISAYDVKSFWKKFNVSTVKKAALTPTNKTVSTAEEKLNAISNNVSPQMLRQASLQQTAVVKQEPAEVEVRQKSFYPQFVRQESLQPVKKRDATEIKILNILRKARMSLKKVLAAYIPVELNESVGCAWNCSKDDVSNFSDQFVLLSKYWNSVFAYHFADQDLFNFKYLATKVNSQAGLSYETNECVTILEIIEDIFTAIKKRKPDMIVPIETIRNNRLKCVHLLFDDTKNTISNNNASAPSSDIVLRVFDYNWNIIHHLCGVVMDFYGIQHDFSYDRLSVMPSEAEFNRLMCDLYPGVLELKKIMFKFVERNPTNTPPGQKFYKNFCNALKNFVPSLQIDVQMPLDTAQFDSTNLEQFFNKPENQERISLGYKQLKHFFCKLQEALSAMVSSRQIRL